MLQSSTTSRYYKVGQELLQSEQVIYYKEGVAAAIKWGKFILAWGNYYEVGHYIDQSYIKELVRKVYCPLSFLSIWDNMLKLPAEGIALFRKLHIFVSVHIAFDAFAFTGTATLRIAKRWPNTEIDGSYVFIKATKLW